MKYLRVRNFDKFQHYKHRNPPWIKLYTHLLEDFDFCQLPDLQQLQLMKLWLLASRLQNAIPMQADWLQQRLGIHAPLDLQALVTSGYCEIYGANDTLASNMLAPCKQDAMPEQSRDRAETEGDGDASNTLARSKRGIPYNPNPLFGGALPPALNTPEFQQAWADWQAHWRQKFPNEVFTTFQARETLGQLERLGASEAVKAIRHTMAKGWKGISTEGDGGNRSTQPTGKAAYND